ncbi:MAG: benzoate-CoA ligase family protein [Acidimicrobiales bacterium]
MSDGALFDPPEILNIADFFLGDRLRDGHADRPAIRTADGSLTYAEVTAMAARYGRVLSGLGVRQEERVLIALPDTPDFPAALFGILAIGAVGVMVNPDQRPDDLAAILEYTRATWVVVGGDYLTGFETAAATSTRTPGFLVVGGESSRHPVMENEASGVAHDWATVATHRDDPAIWLFSGGTTGRPKAVVQTHRSYANTAVCYGHHTVGYRPDDVTISVPKLYFGYATGSNLFFPFSVGATSVLFAERPAPEVLFEQIARHHPTILVNVPSMVNAMVSHPDAATADLSSLRFATSAGEALPEGLYHRWKDTFGVELLDGLGTAEMWHIFVSNRPEDVRPGTVGKVVPGFDVRVADPDGRPLPDGEVGRLWVRGGSRAIAYWQNMEQTADAFRGDWYASSDLVSRDADGYFTHRGRADDAIKVKGKWLRPQEVEDCLLAHPAVETCAVVGAEDEAGLMKPYAFVVAKEAGAPPAPLAAELQRWVLDRLEAYKHPRRVIVVDALPETHLGKVDRGRLRQRVRTPN